MTRVLPRTLLILLMALTLAACGDGGGGEGEQLEPGEGVPATAGATATAGEGSQGGEEPEPLPLEQVRVRLEQVATLERPVAMTSRRGDDAVYVAEAVGRVRAIEGGQVRPAPVLDVSDRISCCGEQGLLGLAFSPDGRFLYVNYTDRAGDTRVVEFTMRGRRADPGSARELLFVDQPESNHNGGELHTDRQGYLWVALGDGGGAGDQHGRIGNGQALDTLLGKLLRIDPRPSGGRPYRIPPDNPFVGRPGARPEIWAYGLRNPWRFSFDRATGDLWIGDVGQGAREEINWAPAGSRGGENYGWRHFEGDRVFAAGTPLTGARATRPLLAYGREDGSCTVIGGYVYRGRAIRGLQGAYLYGDYCGGYVKALRQRGGRVVEGPRELGLPAVPSLSSFGQDSQGELYVMTTGGAVFKLVPA